MLTDKHLKEYQLVLDKVLENTISDIQVLEELTKPISPENSIGRV